MIKVSSLTEQDFLDKETCMLLQNNGIDMTDANYFIGTIHKEDYIVHKSEDAALRLYHPVPTYTLSELLRKLQGKLLTKMKKGKVQAPLEMYRRGKDYVYGYYFEKGIVNKDMLLLRNIEGTGKTPISGAAFLLLSCVRCNDIEGDRYVKNINE